VVKNLVPTQVSPPAKKTNQTAGVAGLPQPKGIPFLAFLGALGALVVKNPRFKSEKKLMWYKRPGRISPPRHQEHQEKKPVRHAAAGLPHLRGSLFLTFLVPLVPWW
jgi:hypothetical protein